MKLFQCSQCKSPVFFENTHCNACGNSLGYLDSAFEIFSSSTPKSFVINHENFTYCSNHKYYVCNWLVPEGSVENFCTACLLNRTIPSLNEESNVEKWKKIEIAKHRLIYSLQRFGFTLQNKTSDPSNGLAFDFLNPADNDNASDPVRTGHANGIITININEADSVYREKMRRKLHEPYRTLIGHLRHEVGHYFWERKILNTDLLYEYRALFGNEQQDYSLALKNYYQNGPPANWSTNYISEYATMHSWEDWAETWSHYLHLVDTLETAHYFGLSISPELDGTSSMNMMANFNPYYQYDFDQIIEASVPMSFAVNSINRSMGQPDLYPFVISPPVVEKLRFIHKSIRS